MPWQAHGIPLVSCFNADVPEGVPVIQPDNGTAMRLAVEHLLAQGHRKIAHLAGPDSHSDARQRREAFEAAIKQSGLPLVVQQGRGGAVVAGQRRHEEICCNRM